MINPFETIEQRLANIEGLILHLRDVKPEPKKPLYLTRHQAAEMLHITLPTLHSYTRMGIIQSHRIGGRILYLESSIEDAVKAIPALKIKGGRDRRDSHRYREKSRQNRSLKNRRPNGN
ncbi:MAG: helix-turn-helix domain-containing protein [Bacteroidales bacterium]|nr:helix-turn-helix domain-containing protein [Bacteroidales bacterium]